MHYLECAVLLCVNQFPDMAMNAGQSFFTDERKTGGSRNVVLQKNPEYSMDGSSLKENGSIKKTYTQNRKKAAKFHWIHYEEGGLETLNPHGGGELIEGR